MSQVIENETERGVATRVVSGQGVERVIKPAVNIRQDAEGYLLEVEIPGVAREDVEVTFEGGKLTLFGRRQTAEGAAKAVYRESSRASYRRVFDLDPSIDATKISATVEQGVLRLHLPKSEAAKPRTIAVS